MYEERFSNWRPWKNRGDLHGLGYPGVYAIAISAAELTATPSSWRAEIVYIGMTNAAAGLKGRLQQAQDDQAAASSEPAGEVGRAFKASWELEFGSWEFMVQAVLA